MGLNMSMHIFNAYLYKDKAEFSDIDKCIQDLVKIKKQYIPWIVKNIVNGKLFIDVDYLKEEYLNKLMGYMERDLSQYEQEYIKEDYFDDEEED
jgi:hypothetical protein